jgi:hypothetical protein
MALAACSFFRSLQISGEKMNQALEWPAKRPCMGPARIPASPDNIPSRIATFFALQAAVGAVLHLNRRGRIAKHLALG